MDEHKLKEHLSRLRVRHCTACDGKGILGIGMECVECDGTGHSITPLEVF